MCFVSHVITGLVLLISSLPAQATASKACVEQANQILTSKTDRLIAYLGQLVEAHTIGDRELSRFLEALERNLVSNPISEEDAQTDSKHMIHRDGLERLVQGKDFDVRRLEEWTRRALEIWGVVRVKRDEAHSQTQETHQKIEFVPIRPGRFQMGENLNKMEVTLTHPFEVMSTLVTQKQWVDLMSENPSKFVDGEHSITVTVSGKQIKMQPDNPVEQVSWWSVLVYANKLSEKRGLKPAYDFAQVKFKPGTRAENGTLDVESGELKIAAPNGNIYETEGYRLPTEAEQEYLLRAAGTVSGNYHFGDGETDLKDYAWYSNNANQTTHPVAQLKPLLIDGKEIYDLHGNVWEWGQDWYVDFPGGAVVNPTGPTSGDYHRRVQRGGTWNGHANLLKSASRIGVLPNARLDNAGFRLVLSWPR